MNRCIFLLGVALCCVSGATWAQPQSQRPATPRLSSSTAVSLHALLQLRGEQDEHLNRLYDEYAQSRAQQEARFATGQEGRPRSFDDRLRRAQIQAQQTIAETLLSKREQALKVLGAVQRSQLHSYAHDLRFELVRDHYYQLLLLPVEELGQVPFAWQERSPNSGAPYPDSTKRSGRSWISGSYGVYGGYNPGGSSYGVYGNAGRGSVGVHAGIGNRGPSIGIGIGRVFGGVRF